jgi:hypothetical protein
MAKKNKGATVTPPAPEVAAPPVTPVASDADRAIDVAYAAGNYAVARKLAAAIPARAAEMSTKIDLDKLQWAVAAGALLVILALGAFTLH